MAQPRLGDLVGRYRLESVLGRGGMGVVYRATDTVLHREVALKVMGGVAGDETFRVRFAQEAAALARLDSPHVVAIHDHGEHRTPDDEQAGEPGAPYLVTQLVAGGDLGSYLADHGALPPTSAAALVAQVAGALRDAHRTGVVHRDVKPANVLLRDRDAVRTDDLHVYLCDFGIAQAGASGLTTTGLVAGTWKYLAPERGRGRPATPASDVYAAGCVLWACLTGRAPYEGDSDVEVAIAHQQEPVPQLGWHDEDLGDGLDRVLRRALAKDPADRYADAGDLRADLLALPRSAVGRAALPTPADGTRTQARHPSHPSHPSHPQHPSHPSHPAARPSTTRPESGPTPHPATGRPGPGRPVWVTALVALLAVLLAAGIGVGLALAVQPDDATGSGEPDPGAAGSSATGSPTRAGTAPVDAGGVGRGPDVTGGVTGDVDGDGLGDLALAGVRPMGEGTGTVLTTYRGTGEGVRRPSDASGVDTRNVPLRGDFDGDGVEEYVAVTSTVSGSLELEPLDGGDPWAVEGAGFEVPPVVGDFDGDGTDDLALLGYPDGRGLDAVGVDGGEVRLALGGEGARRARPALGEDLDPVADQVVPADLDGDGDDDLALLRPQGVRGGTLGSLTLTPVLADDGRLRVGEQSAPQLRLAGTFARPADLDGDGTDQVALVGNTGGEQVRMFGLGPGDLLAETDPWGSIGGSTGTRSVRAVGTSDLDGDGTDDLTLVRAEPGGGPVTGIDVLTGSRGATSAPFLDLGGAGLATAKIADGAVSRPFDLAS